MAKQGLEIDMMPLIDAMYAEVKRLQNDFYRRLDIECEKVLKEAGFEIETLTPEIVAEAGYVIAYTPEGAASVFKNDLRVSEWVYPPRFIEDEWPGKWQ